MREFTVQSEPLMQHARKLWAARGEGKTFPHGGDIASDGQPRGSQPHLSTAPAPTEDLQVYGDL